MQLRCCSWRNFWNDVLNLWVSAWTLNGSSYFDFLYEDHNRSTIFCDLLVLVTTGLLTDCIIFTNLSPANHRLIAVSCLIAVLLLSWCCSRSPTLKQPFQRQWHCKFFVHVCNNFGCAVVSCEHMRGNILCEHKTLGIRFSHAKAFSVYS